MSPKSSQVVAPVPAGPGLDPAGALIVASVFPESSSFRVGKAKVGTPVDVKKWWPIRGKVPKPGIVRLALDARSTGR